ncbi:MAG: SCO family protein [Balneolaceae bacterium]|nr:SCO family protein [Balneolaceae bacterium]
MTKFRGFVLLIGIIPLLLACQDRPEVIKDLSEASFKVVNQDSSTVNFPQDFKGKYTIVGFIYTHCPDVCPVISAKLSNVNKQLEDNSDVQFVQITFDPKRDTPSVLKKYMQQFKQDKQNFTAITGDSATIDTLLSSMDILAKIADKKITENGEETYLMNHTNRILVMDKQARVRYEYPGSVVKEEHVIDDLNALR